MMADDSETFSDIDLLEESDNIVIATDDEMSIVSSVTNFIFSPNGWIITFGVILAYFVYHNAIVPKLSEMKKQKELESRKKFDEEMDEKVADRILAARQKQQDEHDRVAEALKREEEEKKKRKLEELKKAEESESTLNYAVRAHEKEKKRTAIKKITAREIIDEYINSKPVVIFSKSFCPFCRKAKAALATFRLTNDQYEIIELDERDDLPMDAIQDELQRMVGSRSVPKVFVSGECIGGGDDTVRLQKEGILEQLVNSAIEAQKA